MNTKKISIIIPIYNAMPYLEECLRSVVCQDYSDKEIILIENGSCDGSLKVCEDYALKYSCVKMYKVNDSSIGAARNLGLKKADGEYIMFVDADDILPDRSVVSKMYKKTSAKAADICVGNFSRLWGEKILHAASHRKFSRYDTSGAPFLFTGFFSVDTLSYVWAKMYRASFIRDNDISFTDCVYAEDKLFNLICAAKGAKYVFLNREVYIHRNTPSSVSNSYRIHTHMVWPEIAGLLKERLEKDGLLNGIWENIIAYTIFFGCFFDCKMEYEYTDKNVGSVVRLLKNYAIDPLSKKSFRMLTRVKCLSMIPSGLYRILIFGFAVCMSMHMYRVLAFGIKLITDLKIDEMLSDTGRKPS